MQFYYSYLDTCFRCNPTKFFLAFTFKKIKPKITTSFNFHLTLNPTKIVADNDRESNYQCKVEPRQACVPLCENSLSALWHGHWLTGQHQGPRATVPGIVWCQRHLWMLRQEVWPLATFVRSYQPRRLPSPTVIIGRLRWYKCLHRSTFSGRSIPDDKQQWDGPRSAR